VARKQNSERHHPERQHTEYYQGGRIWAKGKMIDGLPTGYWEWFRTDGTKMGSGHYDRGQQVGQWITYDKKGRKNKVTNIKPNSK
jgi:antitoxin component YwqK of YwqJK toxin-antitoxin module